MVNPAMVERHLRIKPGDTVDAAEVNADLLRLYGDGYYQGVDYSLLSTVRGRNILRVTPIEKNWGPDYIRYGVNLDTNFQVDSTYNLRAAYQKTWLNTLGGELLLSGEIGSRSGVAAELYHCLLYTSRCV